MKYKVLLMLVLMFGIIAGALVGASGTDISDLLPNDAMVDYPVFDANYIWNFTTYTNNDILSFFNATSNETITYVYDWIINEGVYTDGDKYCYQESADTGFPEIDGSCNISYTGNYGFTDANFTDGNWYNSSISSATNDTYYYYNYTIPIYNITGARAKISGFPITYVDIPDTCFDYNETLQLRIYYNEYLNETNYQCNNGSWINYTNGDTNYTAYLLEEGMYWLINETQINNWTLDSSYFSKGDTISLNVTAQTDSHDDVVESSQSCEGNGTSCVADDITILNSLSQIDSYDILELYHFSDSDDSTYDGQYLRMNCTGSDDDTEDTILQYKSIWAVNSVYLNQADFTRWVESEHTFGFAERLTRSGFEVYDDGSKMIRTNQDGTFRGYDLVDGVWTLNSTLVCGLSDVGFESKITIFENNGVTNAIIGEHDTVAPDSKYWNGSCWVAGTIYENGLEELDDVYGLNPETFRIGDDLFLVFGKSFGMYEGYKWDNDYQYWAENSSIIDGLDVTSDYYHFSSISVVNYFETNIALIGNSNGNLYELEWNGTAWEESAYIDFAYEYDEVEQTFSGYTSDPELFLGDGFIGLLLGQESGDVLEYYVNQDLRQRVDSVNIYSTTSTVKGSCQPFDGTELGNSDGGSELMSNDAPVITNVYLTPTYPTPSDDITGYCNITDGDSGSFSYEMYLCVNQSTCEFPGGANWTENNALSYSIEYGNYSAGTNLTLLCRVTDGVVSATPVSSSNYSVAENTAPTIQNTSIYSPLSDAGDNLKIICNSTDAEEQTVTYNYKLYKNGVLYTTVNDTTEYSSNEATTITTSITYKKLYEGDNWAGSCQAIDEDGASSSWSSISANETVIADGQPPVAEYYRLYPIIMFNSSSLYALTNHSDFNGDNATHLVRLYKNETLVETITTYNVTEDTETRTNFTYTNFSAGDIMRVGLILQFVNGFPMSSSEYEGVNITVRATNTAPTVVPRIAVNGFIGSDDDITGYCTPTDADGDDVSFDYIWYVNDTAVDSGSLPYGVYSGYDSGVEVEIDTLNSSLYNEGDNVTFSCRANDTVDVSSYTNTTTYLIYGSNDFAPVMTSVRLYPDSTTMITLQSIDVYLNSSDNDNEDVVQYEYRVVTNGVTGDLQTTDWYTKGTERYVYTISSENTTYGDSIYVKARAYDGETYSDWMDSNTFTIINIPPVTFTSQILNINPVPENQDLLGYCRGADPDSGQDVSYLYIWYVNSIEADRNLVGTLDASHTSVGDVVQLHCYAYDGLVYSSVPAVSPPVSISDSISVPTLNSVSIYARPTFVRGRCQIDDADGDKIDYNFRFYKNGVLYNESSANDQIQGTTQEVFLYETIMAGDSWIFSCNGTDNPGDGSVAWTNSTTLTIPSLSFSYLYSETGTTITTEWTTNAQSVQVYLDGVLQADTELIEWTIEGLSVNTQYEITLIPISSSGFHGGNYTFNVTTDENDNNAPVIVSSSMYAFPETDDNIQANCKATDVDSAEIYYTYEWKVNGVSTTNGVSSWMTQGTTYTFPSLSYKYTDAGDTITMVCTAYDDYGASATTSQNITVLNGEPTFTDAFITLDLNDTEDSFVPTYTYTDKDSDEEIASANRSYVWYKNGVNVSTSSTYSVLNVDVDDVLICEITSGDATHNVTFNTSAYTVGDFEAPTISSFSVPVTTIIDTTTLISVVCTDNVGIAGSPTVTMRTPSYTWIEFDLDTSGGSGLYSTYYEFNITGTYTEIEVECKDRNGNMAIAEPDNYITVMADSGDDGGDTGGSTGGSGDDVCGDGICTGSEDFVTCPSDCKQKYEIDPEQDKVYIGPGQRQIVEFEVTNKANEDLAFTSVISSSDTAYEYMDFGDDLKSFSFEIESEGGLSTDNKYVRYYIEVPKDILDEGETTKTLNGKIELNADGETQFYSVEIVVQEGYFDIWAWLNYELFDIPFTKTPITGAELGEDLYKGVPFTVLHLLILLSIGGLIMVGYKRFKN